MEPLQDRAKLLRALKRELALFDAGGYGNIYRNSRWRSTMLLRDSPFCTGIRRISSDPCGNCVLLSLVPVGKRGERLPCHHIPLNPQGDTIARLYQEGSQGIMDARYRAWLENCISELETE